MGFTVRTPYYFPKECLDNVAMTSFLHINDPVGHIPMVSLMNRKSPQAPSGESVGFQLPSLECTFGTTNI